MQAVHTNVETQRGINGVLADILKEGQLGVAVITLEVEEIREPSSSIRMIYLEINMGMLAVEEICLRRAPEMIVRARRRSLLHPMTRHA